MATLVKFYDFPLQLATGDHVFGTHNFKVYLTNNTPDANNHVGMANLAEITAANGYPAGGSTIGANCVRTANTAVIAGNDVTFTAAGGNFGPFRYAVLYNANSVSPANALVCYWDYGSSINCNNGESFTVDFGANILVLS